MKLRSWVNGRPRAGRRPVVLIHGGPGLPDYLCPLAEMIEDLTVVYRYDQRGVGGSRWDGEHTLELHLQDLDDLLDSWGHDRVVLVGHSYGTDLAARFCLRRPQRVAGMVLVAGPFVGAWREADQRTRDTRMSPVQRLRLAELAASQNRSPDEEVELLTLSWFTDHYDSRKASAWASQAARTRTVNWTMNSQISQARRANPLEDRLSELAEAIPASTALIGGAGDPRPAAALELLGRLLDRPVVIVPDAGHEPWLEEPAVFKREFRTAVLASVDSLP